MHGDVLLDSEDEIGNATEHATAQTFGSDIAKETLHHVQPRCGGRREMHGKPRMFHEPLLDLWVLVGGIVIADQMQLFALGSLALNLAQEVEKSSHSL